MTCSYFVAFVENSLVNPESGVADGRLVDCIRGLFARAAQNDRAPEAVAQIVKSAADLLVSPETELAGEAFIEAAIGMHLAACRDDYSSVFGQLSKVFVPVVC